MTVSPPCPTVSQDAVSSPCPVSPPPKGDTVTDTLRTTTNPTTVSQQQGTQSRADPPIRSGPAMCWNRRARTRGQGSLAGCLSRSLTNCSSWAVEDAPKLRPQGVNPLVENVSSDDQSDGSVA